MITTAQVCTAPQEGPRVQVYYLDGDTDHDTHDTACCCATPSPLPHRAIGASLYKLDLSGARAWHALRTGTDTDSFAEWCQRQESQGTSYGVDSQAAIAAARASAQASGWRLLNYPEKAQSNLQEPDSRANYQDMPLYRRYRREPDKGPLLTPSVAPFPVWLVPPGWRLARLSDVAAVTGYAASPSEAGALLTLCGIVYAPPPIELLGAWGWSDGRSAAVVTWRVEQTGEYLVLWRVGKA